MALRAEGEENSQRKGLTPVEAVKLGKLLEPLERSDAKQRQQEHGNRAPGKGNTLENFTEVLSPTRALDHVATAVGMSRPTYAKAKEIVDAAEESPELYADLVLKLHETGKVDGIHKKMTARKKQAALTEIARQGAVQPVVDNVTLLLGNFQDVMSRLPAASVDVIITDPPYLGEYVDLYGDLAEQAKRVLKPGGSMLVMTGQFHLPEVIAH